MDGSNVNWKLFKNLSNDIEEETNKQPAITILEVGRILEVVVFTFYTMLTRLESIHALGM